MANDMYLPAVNRLKQTNGMDRTMQMPQSIPSQPQQYALQQQNDLLNLNPKSTGGTPEIPEKKKGKRGPKPKNPKKPTKKQLREEEQRLALEKQRQELEQNRLKSSAPQAFRPKQVYKDKLLSHHNHHSSHNNMYLNHLQHQLHLFHPVGCHSCNRNRNSNSHLVQLLNLPHLNLYSLIHLLQ